MKLRIAMFAVLILAVQVAGFGQAKEAKTKHSSPIVIEEEIKSISISDNLDVIFIQNTLENETVKVQSGAVGKIKASMINGTLFLSATKRVTEGERLLVYVNVNRLEELRLKGNAFAISYDILHSDNLEINISKEAKVMLRSNGKVEVNSPGSYQLSKEPGYSYVSTFYQ
jgi:hypothetical protein